MECPSCKFLLDGSTIESGQCPNCGSNVRDHMNVPGSSPPGDLRDMVDPGISPDQGGNPLGEGILGDWKPQGQRDEYFASALARSVTSMAHSFQVDMSGPRALVHGGNMPILSLLGAKIEGQEPGEDLAKRAYGALEINPQNPVTVDVEHPEYEAPVTAALQHGRDIMLKKLGPAAPHILPVLQGIKEGSVPRPSHWGDPQPQAQPAPAVTGHHATMGTERLAWHEENPPVYVEPYGLSERRFSFGPGDILHGINEGVKAPGAWFGEQMDPNQNGLPDLGKAAEVSLMAAPLGLAKGAIAKGAPAVVQGAEAGGALNALKGLAGKGLKALPNIAKWHAIGQIGQAALGGGGGGAVAPGGAVPGGSAPQSYAQLSSIHEQLTADTSDLSVPSIGEGVEPDQVDPHESPANTNLYDPTVDNATGGYDTGQSYHGPQLDPEVEDAFFDALPELLDYYEREESGIEDPKIRRLHELLEAKHPEDYANSDGAAFTTANIKTAFGPILPMPQTGAPPATGAPAAPAAPAAAPGVPCPNGAVRDPVTGECIPPQAPAAQPAPVAPVTMQPPIARIKQAIHDHQGPANSEQFAAVAEYLQQTGREQEIVTMLASPWDYAEELALVQQQPNKPPIDQSQPPQATPEQLPPPAPTPGAPGAPMGGPPGGAPPGMPPGMAAALAKVGADSAAPRCPKCGSATTGIDDLEGNDTVEAHCHSCGNRWTPKGLDTIKQTKVASGAPCPTCGGYPEDYWSKEGGECPSCNGIGKTADDHDHAPTHEDLHVEPDQTVDLLEPSEDSDPHPPERQWADSNGEPLKVGQQYQMHSGNYSIPDLVKVNAIKPDAIDLTIVGEMSAHADPDEQLSFRHEIPKEEVDLEQLTFEPTDAFQQEQRPEESQAVYNDYGPGDTTDTSSPHVNLTKALVAATTEDEVLRLLAIRKEAPGGQHSEAWGESGSKRNRQYEHIKQSCLDSGKSEEECKELAAKTVNKTRAEHGETKDSKTAYQGEPGGYDSSDDYWKPQGQRGWEQGLNPDKGIKDEDFAGFSGQGWAGQGPGRGLIDQEGNVHTWNEEEGDHNRYIAQTGVQPRKYFGIGADGSVHPYDIGEPLDDTDYQLLANSHPNISGPAQEQGDELFGFSKLQEDTPDFSKDSHEIAMDRADPDLEWLRSGSVEEVEISAEDVAAGVDPDLAWLTAGGGFDPHTAGKKFSPSQQRKFVDEEGTARNADKLNLEGTHYEARDQGNGYNVDEDDFCLGLL